MPPASCMVASGIQLCMHFLTNSIAGSVANVSDWSIPAHRSEDIYDIASGCLLILKACGHSMMLSSVFSMWLICNSSLALFETQMWPGQPSTMTTDINMPQTPEKLSALVRSMWRDDLAKLPLALTATNKLKAWVAQHYDTSVQSILYGLLSDTQLILQSSIDLVSLHYLAYQLGDPFTPSNSTDGPSIPAIADVPLHTSQSQPSAASSGGT